MIDGANSTISVSGIVQHNQNDSDTTQITITVTGWMEQAVVYLKLEVCYRT